MQGPETVKGLYTRETFKITKYINLLTKWNTPTEVIMDLFLPKNIFFNLDYPFISIFSWRQMFWNHHISSVVVNDTHIGFKWTTL